MKRGEWPCTLSHRLRGSTPGIFSLGAIGNHPLLAMPTALCVPHLGWAEWDNFELYFSEIFEQIVAYARGDKLRLANPDVKPR